MVGDVVDGVLSHLIVENFAEEGSGLGEIIFGVESSNFGH